MDTLTTTTIVLGAVALLLIVLIGIVIGRKRSSRNHSNTSRRLGDNVPRHRFTAVNTQSPTHFKTSSRSSKVESHIAVKETVTSVQKLEAKLLVRLSRDQMSRNKEFERERNPHLDEIALLEKMLYDLERGR